MKKLLFLLLLLLVAATPIFAASTQGTCGDNICRADTGEDKQTCPTDCGTPPESKLVFSTLWLRAVPAGHWGDHTEVQISINFYYYNTTKLVHGTELDAAQHIDSAKCIVEINNNTLEMTNYYSDIKYTTTININDGQYDGIIKCTSNLGNKSWPIHFTKKENLYYLEQTISPDKIGEQSVQDINNSIYRDYVNLTQIQQEQNQSEQHKPSNSKSSFSDAMGSLMGIALLGIAIFVVVVLSIVYAIIRVVQYLFNIGKGAKPPSAALAILLTGVLAIAFLPLLILIPVIITLKIIHKIITAIIPKKK